MWCNTGGDGRDGGSVLGVHLGMAGRISVTGPSGDVVERGRRPPQEAGGCDSGSMSSRGVGPSPAEQRRLRYQVVVAPLVGATTGILAGLLLLMLGEEAPLPWWPFVLFSTSLLLYVLLVGRRLAPRTQPTRY